MKKNLTVIFLTVFIYLLGFGIIIPIIPILSRDFGATATQTGLLMSLYSFMQFIFAPFWGKLSDQYGRRPILTFCLLGEAISYILFAYARNLELLFIARALAGFFGASISTASAYISDVTEKHERSKGMALIGVAFGLGFMIGPALGGGLAMWGQRISSEKHFDTQFAALWVAGICFATFLFAYRFLQESLKEKKSQHHKSNRFKILGNYLKRKTVGPLIIVFALTSLAMSSMEATLVLFAGQKFGWTIREVSFGFAYLGLIIVFTQGFLVRKLIPKIGERNVLRAGVILFSIGMFGIALAPTIPMMALTMTLLSIGNGLTNPSTLGSVSLLTGSDEQGVTLGLTQSMASLGRIIGPAMGGFIYQNIAIEGPFINSGLMGTIAVIIVLTIYHSIPQAGKNANA